MTSFSRVGIGLSHRLKSLAEFYQGESHVWDIGCDHGLLGLSFWDIPEVKSLHLVDPSDKVIETLQKKIKDAYITKGLLFIHHQAGQTLNLERSHNLIFIAGMGGKEIGEIVSHLLPQLDETSRIVIAPHRKILELRALLNRLPLELMNEKVIYEDGQYYPILQLKPSLASSPVSLYGEKLWVDEIGEKYRLHQIAAFKAHADLASQEYVHYLKRLKSLNFVP